MTNEYAWSCRQRCIRPTTEMPCRTTELSRTWNVLYVFVSAAEAVFPSNLHVSSPTDVGGLSIRRFSRTSVQPPSDSEQMLRQVSDVISLLFDVTISGCTARTWFVWVLAALWQKVAKSQHWMFGVCARRNLRNLYTSVCESRPRPLSRRRSPNSPPEIFFLSAENPPEKLRRAELAAEFC